MGDKEVDTKIDSILDKLTPNRHANDGRIIVTGLRSWFGLSMPNPKKLPLSGTVAFVIWVPLSLTTFALRKSINVIEKIYDYEDYVNKLHTYAVENGIIKELWSSPLPKVKKNIDRLWSSPLPKKGGRTRRSHDAYPNANHCRLSLLRGTKRSDRSAATEAQRPKRSGKKRKSSRKPEKRSRRLSTKKSGRKSRKH